MAQKLYEHVTKTIIEQLEQGVRPWTKPWKSARKCVALVPTNIASGRAYSGMNILLLWAASTERGYGTHGWMTFRQANALGGHVRKGEKATTVIYTAFKEVTEDDKTRTVPMLKLYSVFNLDQLDGLPANYLAPAEPWPEDARLDALKRLTEASGIKVHYGAEKAFYDLPLDEVFMPTYCSFKNDDSFCSTLCHELAHATGHSTRLNRKFRNKEVQKAYATEECVAELTSAFVCAHLGFSYVEAQSPAYIQSWLKVLKEDNRAIFSIASYASHAADWLRDREHAITGPEDPDELARKKAEQDGEDIAA